MNLDILNSNLLKKLTIVIPTYNRQAFMLRSMQYWSGKSVSVIYLDGSKKAIDPSSLTYLETNIKYIHNPLGVCERILSSINFVVTEYVMLGCDDEFYIPYALNACLIKLYSDSRFVTCCGLALGFDWYNNSVVGYNVYNNLKGLILDDNSSIARLRKHFSNYVPAHIYAICRSSIWKIVVKTVYSKEYNFFASSEIQMEFLLCYAGKSLVLPELFWLRSGECPPLYGTSDHINPSRTFLKWWFDKDKEKEKNDFIVRMESACRELSRINKEDYILDIHNILETLIKSEKIFFLFRFYKYLPNSMRSIIKKIFKIFGHDVTKKTSLVNLARSLEVTGVHVEYNELEVVKKIIHSFYKN